MILAPSLQQQLNGNNILIMNFKQKFSLVIVIFSTFFSVAQDDIIPEKFIIHKVQKGENLYMLSKKYEISIDQIQNYNPQLIKRGLKKRMQLRIPVYSLVKEKNKDFDNTIIYLVKPKDTKWRIAYTHGISVDELEKLNPSIKNELRYNQEIILPNQNDKQKNKIDSDFYYYKIKPKEGYYRIKVKTGINKTIIDSLNPSIIEGGLRAGMVLKLPMLISQQLNLDDGLLTEKINLEDSILKKNQIKIVYFLPFKSSSIEFDSLNKTERYLKRRTLTSIALDFYSGSILAMEKAKDLGIKIDVKVFDTQNKINEIQNQINNLNNDDIDVIVGPMLPKNFNYLTSIKKFENVPKVNPLSSNPVKMRKGVYQSITPKSFIQDKMKNYLKKSINENDNIIIVSDSINRKTEKDLLSLFPNSIKLRPEFGDFLLPELVDSLIVDTLPNKIILETDKFSLISSASSQIRSQLSDEKKIKLYTTYHGSSYEDINLSNSLFGDLDFTYMSDYFPRNSDYPDFIDKFINRFGMPPNKTAFKGFDLVYDLILRITTQGDLFSSIKIGETEYLNYKFNYVPVNQDAYINNAYFLLKHHIYDVIEINK